MQYCADDVIMVLKIFAVRNKGFLIVDMEIIINRHDDNNNLIIVKVFSYYTASSELYVCHD